MGSDLVPARSQRRHGTFAVVGTSAALLVLGLGALRVFDQFEYSVWDLRVQTLSAPSAVTPLIDVILVDQSSLVWVEKYQGQSWPWPREYFGLVANFLTQAGAKVSIFDVLFDQPSDLAGDDETFASFLAQNGRVVLAEAVEPRSEGFVSLPPVEPLASSVAALGHVSSSPDSDGTNRRIIPLLTLANGTQVPSLALAAWSLGTGRPIPLEQQADSLLRYRGPQKTHPTWSAAQVLRSAIQLRDGEKPDLDPSLFRDHYVFFGYSAPGLMDLRPSPGDPRYPGVEIHATHLDNLLVGDAPRVPAWYGTSLMVVVWAVASAWAVGRLRRATATAPVFLLAVALPVAAGWAAYAAGWWWPVVPPVVAGLVAGLAMLLVNYAGEGRQRRFIQNAFRQYLSPEVIQQLVEDPSCLLVSE